MPASFKKPLLGTLALVVAAGIGWGVHSLTPGVTTAGLNPAVDASGAAVVSTTGGETLTTNTIPDMVASASPAVVTITATTNASGGAPYGFGGGPSQDQGAGFFISPSGELITNDHVVNGASIVQVQLPGHPGFYNAKVIGTDYNMDLALLQVKVPFQVPYLTFGNSSQVEVGQFAVAIGNPEGLGQSTTLGIISALGRPITIQNRQYVNLLQTDAAINPGNSGGPLLNLQGQVIGVDTATETSAQGMGFAIPASQVVKAIPYLQKGQTVPQAWLGVEITDANPTVDAQENLPSTLYGALITSLISNGPAGRAGIRPGDVITAVNGVTIASSTDLLNTVSADGPGQTVTLTIWRSGTTRTISVTLGTKPQNLNLNPSQP